MTDLEHRPASEVVEFLRLNTAQMDVLDALIWSQARATAGPWSGLIDAADVHSELLAGVLADPTPWHEMLSWDPEFGADSRKVTRTILKRRSWPIRDLLLDRQPKADVEEKRRSVAFQVSRVKVRLGVVWQADAVEEAAAPRAVSDLAPVSGSKVSSAEDKINEILDLQRCFKLLEERDRLVLELRFRDGLSLVQSSEVMGVSDQRVHQIESRALKRLVGLLNGERPKERKAVHVGVQERKTSKLPGRLLTIPTLTGPHGCAHQVGDVLRRGADRFEVLGVGVHRVSGYAQLLVQPVSEARAAADEADRLHAADLDFELRRIVLDEQQQAALDQWELDHPDWVEVLAGPDRSDARKVEKKELRELEERLKAA